LKTRARTCSADSGCDPGSHEDDSDISMEMLEENGDIWSAMLESWLKQKLNTVKEDLKLNIVDEVFRVTECKKSSLKFLMNTVNRDVKEIIVDKFEELDRLTKCEEVMVEEGRDVHRMKRKATGQIQHRHQKLRRFDDVEDAEDCLRMFDDWDWSSDEFDCNEKQTGKQDKEPLGCTKLHLNFYDDSDVRNGWNDFNFWKFDVSFPLLPSLKIDIQAEDSIAREDPAAQDLLMEYEVEDRGQVNSSRTTPTCQMFSMKPSRHQATTKYKWPQTQKRILNESVTFVQDPRKSAKLLPKQP